MLWSEGNRKQWKGVMVHCIERGMKRQDRRMDYTVVAQHRKTKRKRGNQKESRRPGRAGSRREHGKRVHHPRPIQTVADCSNPAVKRMDQLCVGDEKALRASKDSKAGTTGMGVTEKRKGRGRLVVPKRVNDMARSTGEKKDHRCQRGKP